MSQGSIKDVPKESGYLCKSEKGSGRKGQFGLNKRCLIKTHILTAWKSWCLFPKMSLFDAVFRGL